MYEYTSSVPKLRDAFILKLKALPSGSEIRLTALRVAYWYISAKFTQRVHAKCTIYITFFL